MPKTQFLMPAMLFVALGASAAQADGSEHASTTQSKALRDRTKPTATYFKVRQDVRRCASPMCGGYFVSAVNERQTVCANGEAADECYVAKAELPEGTSLTNGALVHGALGVTTFPGRRGKWGVLKADFAGAPVLKSARDSRYLLAFDTGIRCITTPCPSVGLTTLNRTRDRNPQRVAFIGSSRDQKLLRQAYDAEFAATSGFGAGALVAGRVAAGTLFVSNVYRVAEPTCVVQTRVPTTTAWNFGSRSEANTFARGLGKGVQVLNHACAASSLPCTKEYNPVHGEIDALGSACQQASNACEFRASVIKAAGFDGKATGSFEKGECADEPIAGCELIDCLPTHVCIEDSEGRGSCVPNACMTVRCTAGTHCEVKSVQCVTTPCNPVAMCVPDLECTGPVIDCAAPPPGCNYEGGGCVQGRWTCGTLACDETTGN